MREYGRAPRGARVEGLASGRRHRRVNVIDALWNGKHHAVRCYAHAANGEFFEWWFSECLLREIPKGHAIIMDNAGFHRKARLRELAKAAGVYVPFLPPYSPDPNPIEKSWANMKRWLRDNAAGFDSVASAIYGYFEFRYSN